MLRSFKAIQKKRTRMVEAVFLGLVIVISFFTYFYEYDQPAAAFWDENYHLASAQKYLNGVFFMEPHPPLGKLFIALGERWFGQNPRHDQFIYTDYAKIFPPGFSFTGYRFFPALFGWLTAPLVYLIFRIIVGSPLIAFLLSFLYLFDNAMIVHERGAMIEGLLLFLTAGMFLQFMFLLRWKNNKSLKRFYVGTSIFGVLFGLLMTTKVLALIMILLIPALLFQIKGNRKQTLRFLGLFSIWFLIAYCCIWQIHFSLGQKVFPALNNGGYYQASSHYRDSVNAGEGASILGFPARLCESIRYGSVGYQDNVPKLDLCKPSENGSSPATWPFGARAISYRWDKIGYEVSHLYLVANPMVWLLGLVGLILAMLFNGSTLFFPVRKRVSSSYLIWVVLSLYWAYMIAISILASTRVMYLYHYFMPLLFTFILFALVVKEIKEFCGHEVMESHKIFFLSINAVLILLAFWFYSPLTYHLPLTQEEFQERIILKWWDLKPKGYEN